MSTAHKMSMSTFLATEGGRKCPMCGRYAKTKDLGWIGFHATMNGSPMVVDAYGHTKGCRKYLKKPKVKHRARR